jgi:tyrosyl-tRNA synthetase
MNTYNQIVSNVSVIGEDEIKEKLSENQTLVVYFGIEPITFLSLKHLFIARKLKDLIKLGLEVKIFIADVHAILREGPDTDIQTKTDECIKQWQILMQDHPSDEKSYSFVKGSDVQLDRRYVYDLYNYMSRTTIEQAKHANNTQINSSHQVSRLIYPLMQVLDETVLEADIQIGDESQRRIFMLSRNNPVIGYKKCSYLITPTLPRLSALNHEILLYDDTATIYDKIIHADYDDRRGRLNQSPTLSIIKYIIFPLIGGFATYNNFDDFASDWLNHRVDTNYRHYIANCIESLIAPIRDKI